MDQPAQWQARLHAIRCSLKLAKILTEVAPKKVDAKLLARLKNLEKSVKADEADLKLILRLEEIREKAIMIPSKKAKPKPNVREYQKAFRELGFDIMKVNPAIAAGKLRKSAIREVLIGALDDWALTTSNQ